MGMTIYTVLMMALGAFFYSQVRGLVDAHRTYMKNLHRKKNNGQKNNHTA